MTVASAGQIQKSGSLTRSIFDSGEFLPIVAVALRSIGAGGAVADVLSNMKGFSMKDILGTTKTIAKQYTPAMAQKKIMNAGNKIKETGKKISDSGAFQAVKQKTGFGANTPKQENDSDFATGQEISPEFGGEQDEIPEEEEPFTENPEEEEEEEKEEEKPYQPFSEPKPEEDDDKKEKEKGNKEEKEKTPKETDQERAQQFQKSKNSQRLDKQKKGKDAKTKKEEDRKKKEEEQKKEFTNIELIVWLPCAIVADIVSIIPYVGLIVSWPFGASFFIFKWVKKFNRSATVMVSALDVILEGLLSTIPANTVDVLITYSISKAKKYGVKIPDAEKKLKKIGGKKPK